MTHNDLQHTLLWLFIIPVTSTLTQPYTATFTKQGHYYSAKTTISLSMASWHIHIVALLETQERGQLAMYALTTDACHRPVNNKYLFLKHSTNNLLDQLPAEQNRNPSSRLHAIYILCSRVEQPTETDDTSNQFQQSTQNESQ